MTAFIFIFYVLFWIDNVHSIISYKCDTDECADQEFIFPENHADQTITFDCQYDGDCDNLVVYVAISNFVVNCHGFHSCNNIEIYCGKFDPPGDIYNPSDMDGTGKQCHIYGDSVEPPGIINSLLSCSGDGVTNCVIKSLEPDNIETSTVECNIGNTSFCELDCDNDGCVNSNLRCHLNPGGCVCVGDCYDVTQTNLVTYSPTIFVPTNPTKIATQTPTVNNPTTSPITSQPTANFPTTAIPTTTTSIPTTNTPTTSIPTTNTPTTSPLTSDPSTNTPTTRIPSTDPTDNMPTTSTPTTSNSIKRSLKTTQIGDTESSEKTTLSDGSVTDTISSVVTNQVTDTGNRANTGNQSQKLDTMIIIIGVAICSIIVFGCVTCCICHYYKGKKELKSHTKNVNAEIELRNIENKGEFIVEDVEEGEEGEEGENERNEANSIGNENIMLEESDDDNIDLYVSNNDKILSVTTPQTPGEQQINVDKPENVSTDNESVNEMHQINNTPTTAGDYESDGDV